MASVHRRWPLLAAMLLVAGCGDDAPQQQPVDAGTDTAVDAGPEQDTAPPRDVPTTWDINPPDADLPTDAEPDTPPDVQTWPADPLAQQNPWGPAGRVVRMEMPSGPGEARQEGCLVRGAKVGTGLNSLLILAGGLDQFLEPNADGKIDVNLYARAVGWEPGQAAEDVEQVELQFLYGDPDPSQGWFIAPRSFVDADPELGPLLSYPDSAVSDGWITGSPGPFIVDLSILGLGIHLDFTAARIAGRLYADGPGLALRRGVLTGYVTQDGALALIHGIQDSCEGEDAPDICGAVANFIGIGQPDEDLIELAGNFIGGYDARIVDGAASDCDGAPGNECNAVSVCILLDADGIEIAGVSP